jgi:hypothetical protein
MEKFLKENTVSPYSLVSKYEAGPFCDFQDLFQNEITVNQELSNNKWYYLDSNSKWQGPISAVSVVTSFNLGKFAGTTLTRKNLDGTVATFADQCEFSLLSKSPSSARSCNP